MYNTLKKKTKNSISYKIHSAVLVTLVLYLSVSFIACGGNSSQKGEVIEEDELLLAALGEEASFRINAVTIVPQTIYRRINVEGSVKAKDSANITPDTSGVLHTLLVEEGEYVRKNQIIAQIDPSRPGEKFLLSPVKASIAGTISTIFIEIGNQVSANSVIAEVANNSELEIELFIPERYANDVQVGIRGTISLIAFRGENFPVITRTASSVLSSVTHTMKAKLDFVNQDERLKSGMFGTVELILEEIPDVPVVRIDYIVQRFRDGKTLNGVFKIIEQDGITLAVFQAISLGIEDGDFYQVTEGLSVGDVIAVTGQESLVENALVELLELDNVPSEEDTNSNVN